jgi:hypothetical protein
MYFEWYFFGVDDAATAIYGRGDGFAVTALSLFLLE